jgi:ribA/ribD-fused uncharacterized protein
MSQYTDAFGEVIIDSFRDDFHFLSNFYPAKVTWNGRKFDTSEHAYQWAKSLDLNEQETILFTWREINGDIVPIPTTPGQAKRAGDAVTKRENWDNIKAVFMLEILRAKFTQNFELRQKLLDTGDAILIEGNTWCDTYWGKCRCPKCGNKGLNVLGSLLMQVREELRREPYRIVCLGLP